VNATVKVFNVEFPFLQSLLDELKWKIIQIKANSGLVSVSFFSTE